MVIAIVLLPSFQKQKEQKVQKPLAFGHNCQASLPGGVRMYICVLYSLSSSFPQSSPLKTTQYAAFGFFFSPLELILKYFHRYFSCFVLRFLCRL